MIPQSSTASDLHRYDLYFVESDGLDDIPAVGDSIRFNPGIATDLSGAHPHDLNPWVRIVGEQKTKISSTTLISVNPLDDRLINSPTVTTHLIEKNVTKDELMRTYGKTWPHY